MKKRVSLRPRERRLAIIAAVGLGTWSVVSWLVQPLWDKTRDLQSRIEAQTGRLTAVSELLEHAPAIEQAQERFAAYLLDDDEEGSVFLNDLEAVARRSNLQLNLKPRPSKQEDRVNRFEVELDVEGPQELLLAFLDELLRMPKLIAIERLRIFSVHAKDRSLRANLVIQKLTLLR